MIKLVKIKKNILPMTHNFRLKSGRILVGFFSVGAAILALTGCTTTMVTKRLDPASTGDPVAGHIYHLPRIDYMVSVDRELTACSASYESDAVEALKWLEAVALTLSQTTTLPDAEDIYNKIQVAPFLVREDIQSYLKSWLGSNWLEEIKPEVKDDKSNFGNLRVRLGERQSDLSKLEPVYNVKVLMRASATPLMTLDPKHAYIIEYPHMQSLLKGTDYNVENYPNGTLKSVNVTIDDQADKVIKGAVDGVAKLAAASGGFPLSLSVGQSAAGKIQSFAEWKAEMKRGIQPCNVATQLRLAQRSALAKQAELDEEVNLTLVTETNELANKLVNELIERDKKQAVFDGLESGDPEEPKAAAELKLAKQNVKNAQKELAKAKEKQSAALEESGSVASKLLAIRKGLTVTKATTITPEPGTKPIFDLKGIDEVKEAWLETKRVDKSCKDKPNECIYNKMKAQAVIYPMFMGNIAEVKKNEVEGKKPGLNTKTAGSPPDIDPTKEADGVFYRQPVSSTLFVCKEQACLDKDNFDKPAVEAKNLLLSTIIDIPQLGTLATLPLKNGTFQNNTIGATFAEDGTLTKLIYKTNAAAAKAAGVFDASADTALQYKEAKLKQESAKLGQSKSEVEAQDALVQAKLSLKKHQDELDKYLKDKNETTE